MSAQILITILKASQISPEELGNLMGVSGMTVRRWIEKPSAEPLSEIYQNAMRDAVYKLVIEGRLDSDSKMVRKIFANPASLSQQAAAKALGFPDMSGGDFANHQEQIMVGLSHIGASELRRLKVDENKSKLPSYKRLGKEWSERISILTRIIGSKNLTSLDKFPAYGALFYLFMPFDLIPDTIPVFGLMDDFAILGIAAAYYAGRKMVG
jgi:uncharacterized membrane protein YkvA (DUF1232 family)